MKYTKYDELMYKKIREQINGESIYCFGSKINITILTDRLLGTTDGLCDYLKQYKDVTLSRIKSIPEAEELCKKLVPDIFIIVGYLENRNLYNILKVIKRANQYASTIIYANIDECIMDIKLTYKIEFMFSRQAPISDFIEFLKKVYVDSIVKKNNDLSSIKNVSYDDVDQEHQEKISKKNSKKSWIKSKLIDLKTKFVYWGHKE